MNDWLLAYDGYVPQQEGLRESLCALGNGYFVTRAAATDVRADDVHYPGTYLAGGYDRLVTRIEDTEVENESLVNVPNWLPLKIRVEDGQWLGPDRCEVLDYRQELDMYRGLLIRCFRYRDAEGRVTRWHEERLVSMSEQHLAAIRLSLAAENWSGTLTVRAGLDASVVNAGVERYRALAGRHLETLDLAQTGEDVLVVRSRMVQSRQEVAEAQRVQILVDGSEAVERELVREADAISQDLKLTLCRGQPVTVEKVVALYTSRDDGIAEPAADAVAAVRRAPRFSRLLERHSLSWRHLWQEGEIQIDTDRDARALMKLRLQIFHLLQTVSYNSIDVDTGVPARGWHGEAYRGHVMWDELFVLPFFNLRIPLIARAMLRYRYRRLDAARRAARKAGYAGAMFPWQSGRDGREESQTLHLNPMSGRWIPDNSSLQRHISADIAYNVWHYYQVTADREFLYYYGAEMLVEIARFWTSIAVYDPAQDRYEIKGVMGPDEFHTAYPGKDPDAQGGLDNNAYTNVLVAWLMARALDAVDLLPADRWAQLSERLEFSADVLERFDELSRKLKVPFHGDGIISQFEGYDALEEFDWERYRGKYGDIHRLDRILESEGDSPNRYKASKQADVLMLFYLFSADELKLVFERLGYGFDPGTIPRNIDYYLARTSHGSTLSWLVHGWVLARADRPRAWDLFQQALNSDFSDIQGGTTPEGIHLGAMAGTVDLVQRCLIGLETRSDVLHIDPVLPEGLGRISTVLRYRGHRLAVEVTGDVLRLRSGGAIARPITIAYRGHVRSVAPGCEYAFRLIPSAASRRAATRRSLAGAKSG